MFYTHYQNFCAQLFTTHIKITTLFILFIIIMFIKFIHYLKFLFRSFLHILIWFYYNTLNFVIPITTVPALLIVFITRFLVYTFTRRLLFKFSFTLSLCSILK